VQVTGNLLGPEAQRNSLLRLGQNWNSLSQEIEPLNGSNLDSRSGDYCLDSLYLR
jgi:hypothetical protein